MSECRSDQEMRDLAATAEPGIPYPAGPTGRERVGDVLVEVSSFAFWAAIWFYFAAGKAERDRKRDQVEDAG